MPIWLGSIFPLSNSQPHACRICPQTSNPPHSDMTPPILLMVGQMNPSHMTLNPMPNSHQSSLPNTLSPNLQMTSPRLRLILILMLIITPLYNPLHFHPLTPASRITTRSFPSLPLLNSLIAPGMSWISTYLLTMVHSETIFTFVLFPLLNIYPPDQKNS